MSLFHLAVIFSVLLSSASQMLLKRGASVPHNSVLLEYLNPWVIGGYAVLFVSLLIDVWAISRGVKVKEVSTIESLSYLFVPLFGYIFFGEKINLRKAASIAIIMAGVIIFFL